MSNHNSPTLSPGEVALARHHTYALLSRLFFEGLTAELRPYAVELVGETATTTGFNADEAAAAHHNLFRFNVFPFQAIFRDASGLLGGEESGRVRAAYAEAGFRVDAEPDQIGHELGLLAFLCGAEAEAQRDERAAAAAHARRLQKAFLQAHLLLWLPPFATALGRAGQPFYAALAALTLDIVADHAAALAGQLVPAGPPLPAPPDLLAQEKTGLKEIAGYLTTPPFSGLYLSRDAINAVGRAHKLPRGFGGRQQLLTNLLHTAVQYDSLEAVLGGFTAVVQEWQAAYANQAAQHPHLAPFVAA